MKVRVTHDELADMVAELKALYRRARSLQHRLQTSASLDPTLERAIGEAAAAMDALTWQITPAYSRLDVLANYLGNDKQEEERE